MDGGLWMIFGFIVLAIGLAIIDQRRTNDPQRRRQYKVRRGVVIMTERAK